MEHLAAPSANWLTVTCSAGTRRVNGSKPFIDGCLFLELFSVFVMLSLVDISVAPIIETGRRFSCVLTPHRPGGDKTYRCKKQAKQAKARDCNRLPGFFCEWSFHDLIFF